MLLLHLHKSLFFVSSHTSRYESLSVLWIAYRPPVRVSELEQFLQRIYLVVHDNDNSICHTHTRWVNLWNQTYRRVAKYTRRRGTGSQNMGQYKKSHYILIISSSLICFPLSSSKHVTMLHTIGWIISALAFQSTYIHSCAFVLSGTVQAYFQCSQLWFSPIRISCKCWNLANTIATLFKFQARLQQTATTTYNTCHTFILYTRRAVQLESSTFNYLHLNFSFAHFDPTTFLLVCLLHSSYLHNTSFPRLCCVCLSSVVAVFCLCASATPFLHVIFLEYPLPLRHTQIHKLSIYISTESFTLLPFAQTLVSLLSYSRYHRHGYFISALRCKHHGCWSNYP